MMTLTPPLLRDQDRVLIIEILANVQNRAVQDEPSYVSDLQTFVATHRLGVWAAAASPPCHCPSRYCGPGRGGTHLTT